MVLTRSQRATGAQTFEVWKIYASYNGIAQFRSEPEEQKASRVTTNSGRVSCKWCKKRFKSLHGLVQHCKALHAHLETPATAGGVLEAPQSVEVEQHSTLPSSSEDVQTVKGVEVQQHLTIPPFSYPGQSNVGHIDVLSNNHVPDSLTSAPTSPIWTHYNKESVDNVALHHEHLLSSRSSTEGSKHKKKAKNERKRAVEAAADSEAQDNAKKPVQVQDQLKCSKCNKKFEVISALVQHLEHERCKPVNERAVESHKFFWE